MSVYAESLKSSGVKFATMVVAFVSNALLFRSLDSESYALFGFISAVLSWLVLANFGVGLAARNRTTKAHYLKRHNTQLFISHVVFSFNALVSLFLVIALSILYFSGALKSILSGTVFFSSDLDLIVYVVFFIFSVGIPFRNVVNELHAQGRSASAQIVLFQSAALGLFVIYMISLFGQIPVMIYLYAIQLFSLFPFIVVYFSKNRGGKTDYNCHLKRKLKYLKILIPQSVNFLFVQILAVAVSSQFVFFASFNLESSLLATFLFLYQISISLVSLYSALVVPFWSKLVKSKLSHDNSGEKITSLKSIFHLWLVFLMVIAIFFLCLPKIDDLFLNDRMILPENLLILLSCYVVLQTINATASVFLNSLGQIFPQVVVGVLQVLIFWLYVGFSPYSELDLNYLVQILCVITGFAALLLLIFCLRGRNAYSQI